MKAKSILPIAILTLTASQIWAADKESSEKGCLFSRASAYAKSFFVSPAPPPPTSCYSESTTKIWEGREADLKDFLRQSQCFPPSCGVDSSAHKVDDRLQTWRTAPCASICKETKDQALMNGCYALPKPSCYAKEIHQEKGYASQNTVHTEESFETEIIGTCQKIWMKRVLKRYSNCAEATASSCAPSFPSDKFAWEKEACCK